MSHNINLVSLKITYPGKLVLKNVPVLVDLHLWGHRFISKDIISNLSFCLSKLEVLSLFLPVEEAKERISEFQALKHLILAIDGSNDHESKLLLTDFVSASPNLEKFFLKMFGGGNPKSRSGRKLETTVKYPHHHLKVDELHGCYGSTSELELEKKDKGIPWNWPFLHYVAEPDPVYARRVHEVCSEVTTIAGGLSYSKSWLLNVS